MTQEEKAKAYDEALERAKKYNIDDAHAYQGTIVKLIFPELRESKDEKIRKALIQEFKEKVQKSFEWKDGIPNNAVLNWLEKQKEPLPIPDKFSGLKSLMLQYLQSAANRKDDAEIESDTDLWGRKILDYVWKYSDEQKEQKPAAKNITNEDITAWSDELLEFANQKYAERVEINKSLSAAVIAELGKYNGENYWKSPWAIDSTRLQYPLYFANLGAAWQKEQKSSSINAASEWLKEHVCCYMNSEYNEFHKCVEYDGSIDKERLINDFEEAMQKEQTPINQCNTLEPTLVEERKWNEAYEKGYSLGYENGRNERKSVQCIDFDNEFENQVSHLIASALNGEYEYDNSFIKHAAQSLMGYAKNELKPAVFNKATINGEPIPTENQSVDIPLAKWGKKDERIMNGIQLVLESWDRTHSSIAGLPSLIPSYIDWLKSLPERLNIQPKQGRSDEDERIMQSIIKDIEFERNYTSAETGKVIEKYNEQLVWFKSLPERFNLLPNNEWSEEDEKIFWGLTAYIPDEELERLGVTRLDILKKLKSLRPQSKVECSEDEMIRKVLIHIVKSACSKYGIKYIGDKITEEMLLAYLEKQKEPNLAMIQWTGNNLKEVIEFTGKSDKFEKWFKSWDEYEAYVRDSGNILKLFCEGDDHYKVPVGAWIIKTPDGHNIPSCFEFVHNPDEIDENKIIKKHITEDVLSSEVNKRLKECGWYVTDEKPAEWSDEDERMLNSILKTLQDEYHDLCNDKYGHEEIISDLKSSCRKKMSWLEALPEKFNLKK